MDKMSLIVFEETGHVLGAFTRTADPEGSVEPTEVVGEGLHLRDPDDGERLVTVEPRHLAVEAVDRLDRVLLAHREYVLVDGVPEEQPALAAPVALDGTEVTLSLPADATEDLEAWVQVEGSGSQPIVRKIEIPSGKGDPDGGGDVSEPLALASGDYGVLALVPGYRLFAGSVSF